MVRKLNKLSILLLTGVLLLATPKILAASKPKEQGITLSPFVQQLSIAPDDTTKSFTLNLTNHTNSLKELSLKIRDFGTLNETGGILLKDNNNYSQKYGLSSWLGLGADTVVLEPGETRGVIVTVNNHNSLQPGGHYGAVVASVNSLNNQAGNKVVINQQLLSLVLANKVGGERYDLKLKNISQNGNWLQLPNNIKLRFQNPGNVHVIPRGTVKLKSPNGTVLSTGIINSESAFVLPESFRELYVPLTTVGKSLSLPGIYHIEVEYRYEGIARTVKKSYAVQYINLKLYIFLAIVAALGIWLARRYWHNKKSKK